MRGTIVMDKFDDPPEPLYTLLMDNTAGMDSAINSFADNE
jgi:hypothetical protein